MSELCLTWDVSDGDGALHARFRPRMPASDDAAARAEIARAVSRAKQGDREALGYLYIRFADNVYGYVTSIVRDAHEAEDVTQQVFAKLLVNLSKYEEREAPFISWILAVARNVALDHMRRRRAIPCAEIPDVTDAVRVEDPLEAYSVKDALAALPAPQREVVLLRHLVGLTPVEIAGRLGRTESSVHGLHHRGRNALCASLRQAGAAPTVIAS
jgi:RNA polymerase sigma-70 factor (ECF subfamily)